jgi:hypothetical protein
MHFFGSLCFLFEALPIQVAYFSLVVLLVGKIFRLSLSIALGSLHAGDEISLFRFKNKIKFSSFGLCFLGLFILVNYSMQKDTKDTQFTGFQTLGNLDILYEDALAVCAQQGQSSSAFQRSTDHLTRAISRVNFKLFVFEENSKICGFDISVPSSKSTFLSKYCQSYSSKYFEGLTKRPIADSWKFLLILILFYFSFLKIIENPLNSEYYNSLMDLNALQKNPSLAISMKSEIDAKNDLSLSDRIARFKRSHNFFTRWLFLNFWIETKSDFAIYLESEIIGVLANILTKFGMSNGSDLVLGRPVKCLKAPGIFAVLKIRDFDNIQGLLKVKTKAVIDEIAEILKGLSMEFEGDFSGYSEETSNFTITWKFKYSKELVFMALIKVFVAIERSPVLQAYRKDPRILNVLGGAYRISLYCGVHEGMGISGIIGSDFHMEPAFFSDDVEIANFLVSENEKVYKIHGILCSSKTIDQGISRKMKNWFRPVARIALQSRSILEICSLDLDVSYILTIPRSLTFQRCVRESYKIQQQLLSRQNQRKDQNYSVTSHLLTDKDFQDMRTDYDKRRISMLVKEYWDKLE